MSRLIFNRMLLLVHGQGDDLATPTRYFRTHCSGCEQGCEFCEAEIANDIGLDAPRNFGPAPFAPTKRDYARWVFRAVAAGAVMAAVLQSFPQ